MLGKSSDKNDFQTSGVLIQYIQELSDYLKERNLSRKAVTMAVAVLVLAGLTGVHYKETGSLVPTSGAAANRELPIYCVQTEEPKIALTFDAAWGNQDTKKIMEILKKHNVKVTFFMTGGWVDG
ncbi:MAG: polysaccharide deacetylase family protein [Lachnospiraceae bacterium]|nr:polysaccharide deacetylase family protein [Lachnospiraceae bacterium]